MISSVTSSTTPAEFRNSVTSSVLAGGATSNQPGGTISDAASLQDAVASAVLTGSANTSGDLSYSPLATADSSPADLQAAITNAVLGGGAEVDTMSALATLGATLNSMAAAAQSALLATNTSDRAKALSNFQSLYDGLNNATVAVDGTAGNAASLGVSAPGNWADANTAAGTAAITTDMSNVVRAHTVVQQMMQSVGATYVESLLV